MSKYLSPIAYCVLGGVGVAFAWAFLQVPLVGRFDFTGLVWPTLLGAVGWTMGAGFMLGLAYAYVFWVLDGDRHWAHERLGACAIGLVLGMLISFGAAVVFAVIAGSYSPDIQARYGAVAPEHVIDLDYVGKAMSLYGWAFIPLGTLIGLGLGISKPRVVMPSYRPKTST